MTAVTPAWEAASSVGKWLTGQRGTCMQRCTCGGEIHACKAKLAELRQDRCCRRGGAPFSLTQGSSWCCRLLVIFGRMQTSHSVAYAARR